MKITSIKQQAKRADRYSVYVDETYAFSLSEPALLESRLASGQELTARQVREFKQLSSEDKLYNQALRYVALRPRSRWELEFYLERKKASSPLISQILNKLSIIGLIDDEQLARSVVHDRQLLRPTSRRKIIQDLRKKRIAEATIEKVMSEIHNDEQVALQDVIERKRRQSKYQDNDKLMQYLARQGFDYGDIKTAIAANDEPD